MVPPPPVLPGPAALQSVVTPPPASPGVAPLIKLPGAPVESTEVDNLVDLLLSEALAPVSSEIRAQISKLGHGMYRFGDKEVTLHTTNGRLFVYRVGMMVRNCPLQTLLQEEGLIPAPAPLVAAPIATAPSVSAVDTSSVAKIASLGAQISSGMAVKTATGQQTVLPFGLSRPPDQKSDPKLLTSKRVEAATRAMDVAIQFARRSIDFDDERFLRKLLAKGLKHDKQWAGAYSDFCAAKGISENDYKKHDKDAVAAFIERNLASSINEDWAKKVMCGTNDEEKKEKKE